MWGTEKKLCKGLDRVGREIDMKSGVKTAEATSTLDSSSASVIAASAFCVDLSYLAVSLHSLAASHRHVHIYDYSGTPSANDVVAVVSGRKLLPKAEVTLPKDHTCKALRWISYGAGRRKRKREVGATDDQLAILLSSSQVLLYSVSEKTIIQTIDDGVNLKLCTVDFHEEGSMWAMDGRGSVYRWALDHSRKYPPSTVLIGQSTEFTAMHSVSSDACLAASNTLYLVSQIDGNEQVSSLTVHKSAAHSIVRGGRQNLYFTAASSDRYVQIAQVTEESKLQSAGALVCKMQVRKLIAGHHIVCAVSEGGKLEVFHLEDEHKVSHKVQTHKPSAHVSVVQGDIFDAVILHHDIIVSWVHRTEIHSARVPLSALNGDITVDLVKDAPAVHTNGIEYDESEAVVLAAETSNAPEATTMSFEEAFQLTTPQQPPTKKKHGSSRPLHERITSAATTLTIPTSVTLTNLLTQAVRASDRDLLETCLKESTKDLILPTLQRLDTQFVLPFLEQLTERVAKSGRVEVEHGGLGSWVQGVMLVHGSYLISDARAVPRLKALHAGLARHAETLPRLISLRGRLELLSKQMGRMNERSRLESQQGSNWIEAEDGEIIVKEDTPLAIEDVSYIKDQDEDDDESDDDEDEDVNGDVDIDDVPMVRNEHFVLVACLLTFTRPMALLIRTRILMMMTMTMTMNRSRQTVLVTKTSSMTTGRRKQANKSTYLRAFAWIVDLVYTHKF